MTNATGVHELSMWVPPGVVPAGNSVHVWGIDFPSSPTPPSVPNGLFNVSNVLSVPYY